MPRRPTVRRPEGGDSFPRGVVRSARRVLDQDRGVLSFRQAGVFPGDAGVLDSQRRWKRLFQQTSGFLCVEAETHTNNIGSRLVQHIQLKCQVIVHCFHGLLKKIV